MRTEEDSTRNDRFHFRSTQRHPLQRLLREKAHLRTAKAATYATREQRRDPQGPIGDTVSRRNRRPNAPCTGRLRRSGGGTTTRHRATHDPICPADISNRSNELRRRLGPKPQFSPPSSWTPRGHSTAQLGPLRTQGQRTHAHSVVAFSKQVWQQITYPGHTKRHISRNL